jgi:hypothetical protein
MAKSRKSKPSFDQPASGTASGTGWVYRSDAAPAPPSAVPVVDVSPVSAVSLPARRVSGVERGIDVVSRPFGLVIMLGMAVLALARRPRAVMALLAIAASVALTGCRAHEIWAGAAFDEDSGQLKVASEEPLCGCLRLSNLQKQDLRLRATLHDTTIGETTIPAGQSLEFRYDWAGHSEDDIYYISATLPDGTRPPIAEALRIDEKSRFESCSTIRCQFGDLMLNVGVTGD